MLMQSLRNGAIGGFLKYILFSLLLMAVAGLVFMDVNGVFRKGISSTDVARIEDRSIGIREFDKMARLTLSRVGLSPQQAYQLGYLDEVLAQEVRANFVMIESEKLGIRIDQSHIGKKAAQLVAPLVQEGHTLQETFDSLMTAQGMSEKEFVDSINREMLGDIMLETIRKGFTGSTDTLARDLFLFQNQTRDIEFITFEDSDITNIAPPDEEETRRLYEVLKSTRFALPEYRALKIAVIDDSGLKDRIDIGEDELRQAYEENIDQYKVPEQHVLEQAIFKNEKDAKTVAAFMKDDGKSMPDAIKNITDEQPAYVPPAPFEADMIVQSIREPVLSAKEGDILGPLKSTLGYHVIRLIEKTPPATRSFEEIEKPLRDEMIAVKTGDRVYEFSTALDDLLAGGATLEEAQKEVPLKFIDIPATGEVGQDRDGNNALLPFGPEQEQDGGILLETAFELQQGEISRVLELPSGKFAALQVTGIEEKTAKPYETVKQEIADQYIADQQRAENTKRVAEMLEQLRAGKTSLDSLAQEKNREIKKIEKIGLRTPLEAPLNEQQAQPVIFKLAPGGYDSLPFDGGSAIIRISGYTLPEIDENVKEVILKPLIAETDKEMQNEGFIMYLRALGEKYTAQINQRLLDQVYRSSEGDN